ncbi:hypothetical protein M422DRAFT_153656 [Sphaerobolus stellatus SS14]|nr:hypothetical protein M422DRAFT_153656 [Sphaerobolus stellatus SS14]
MQQNSDNSLLSFLRYYENPGITPPFSRVDPSILQREYRRQGIFGLWKLLHFMASKGIDITRDVLSHFVHGPRRPSWGLEMTIITSLVRNANQYSHLTNLRQARLLFALTGFLPVPPSALVTPVTFRVHKRRLRGILAEYDAKEDGSRELSGEWVISKHLWHRLQAEWKATKEGKQKKSQENRSIQRIVLYLHGGAYYVSSAAGHRLLTIPFSKFAEARVLAIDYRLAPETKFPGPLHDVVYAYMRLLDDLNIPPENILIAGDSAGGGLSLALLMYLRDNGYPMPAGAILFSPWVDLTMSCESWDSNKDCDLICLPEPGDHMDPILCYLGKEGIAKYLTHPYASPLFGSFEGLPPLLIQCGDAERLRDEITLLGHKAAMAGVDVRHDLFKDGVHVFQAFPHLENTQKAFASMRQFVRQIIPRHQSKPPQVLDSPRLDNETKNLNSRVVRDDGIELPTTGSPSQQLEEACTDSEDTANESSSASFDNHNDYGRASSCVTPPVSRDTSHPDMARLCQDWARGPANYTTSHAIPPVPTAEYRLQR